METEKLIVWVALVAGAATVGVYGALTAHMRLWGCVVLLGAFGMDTVQSGMDLLEMDGVQWAAATNRDAWPMLERVLQLVAVVLLYRHFERQKWLMRDFKSRMADETTEHG